MFCSGDGLLNLERFVLYLSRANAKIVYACEWNPPALDALRYNLHINGVEGRCIVLEGDNRCTAPCVRFIEFTLPIKIKS